MNTAAHTCTLLRAFGRARFGLRFADRAALLAWQARQVERFVTGPLRAVPFYRGSTARDVHDLPVVDKAAMLARFHEFNRAGVQLQTALDVAERAERERDFTPTLPRGITVGLSSGTSGRRGVFLVSARERSRWAGTVLARVLSGRSLRRVLHPLAPPLRVAFFLRASSNLYTGVASRRVRFEFFDLLQPLAVHVPRLAELAPDVLVAPASVLAALARSQQAGALQVAPDQIVSVAEVLEADDATRVAEAWGRRPGQVYQCTEGLLGQTCPEGSLHLNEELVHFEPEWLDAERTRFVPRVTDFTRTTQVFARYRLDDVLRIDPHPCPCGRVTMRLQAVEGRCDDVLWLPAVAGGALQPLFPDVVRRAMLVAAPDSDDWRVEQAGDECHVRVRGRCEPAAIEVELRRLCVAYGFVAPHFRFLPWAAEPAGGKRRRVRCITRPESVPRA